MMPLNYILKVCTVGYKFTKLQEKIYHFMYMEDVKLFAITHTHTHTQTKRIIGESETNNKNIQLENRNGIWHIKVCYAHNEK